MVLGRNGKREGGAVSYLYKSEGIMPGGQGGQTITRWVRHTWVQVCKVRYRERNTLIRFMRRRLGLSTEHCGQDTVQSSCPLAANQGTASIHSNNWRHYKSRCEDQGKLVG